MKINKFNESYRGNKIIKQYNKSLLAEYQADVELSKVRLEDKKNNILKLINEYIEINKEYFQKKYSLYSHIKIFKFDVDNDTNKPYFYISISNYAHDFKILKYDDFEGILKFMEDPDLYRNKIKYNI